jgi:hypothetical protein
MSALFGQPLSLTTCPTMAAILAPFVFEKEVYHLPGVGDE